MITARAGSSRLPNKYRQLIDPFFSILNRVHDRCSLANVEHVTVVCPDEDVWRYCIRRDLDCECCPPDDRDVTRQLLEAADRLKTEHIALVTGDEPFISPKVIDDSIAQYFRQNVTFLYHDHPKGMEVRVLSTQLLRDIDNQLKSYREHGTTLVQPERSFDVSTYYWSSLFHPGFDIDYSVDTPEDLAFAQKIASMTAWDAPAEEIMKCASEIQT